MDYIFKLLHRIVIQISCKTKSKLKEITNFQNPISKQ